jgi:hypothetical protein
MIIETQPCTRYAREGFYRTNLELFVTCAPALRALHSEELCGTGDIALYARRPIQSAIFTIRIFRHICSRICQLKSSRLGTKKFTNFSIFLLLEADFSSQIVYCDKNQLQQS